MHRPRRAAERLGQRRGAGARQRGWHAASPRPHSAMASSAARLSRAKSGIHRSWCGIRRRLCGVACGAGKGSAAPSPAGIARVLRQPMARAGRVDGVKGLIEAGDDRRHVVRRRPARGGRSLHRKDVAVRRFDEAAVELDAEIRRTGAAIDRLEMPQIGRSAPRRRAALAIAAPQRDAAGVLQQFDDQRLHHGGARSVQAALAK